MVKIWPQCRQLHASTNFSFEECPMVASKSDLIEQIFNVMRRTFSCSWSRSLRFLQWELNTTCNQGFNPLFKYLKKN